MLCPGAIAPVLCPSAVVWPRAMPWCAVASCRRPVVLTEGAPGVGQGLQQPQVAVRSGPSKLQDIWRGRGDILRGDACVWNTIKPWRRTHLSSKPFATPARWESPQREVVRSSAGASGVYPPFGGHSRSIPQGMILDVQPFVKSLFCPIRPSPDGFFDSEASIP